MTKEEVVSEIIHLLNAVETSESYTALDTLQNILGREADMSLLQDYVSSKYRDIMSKEKHTDEDKIACATLLTFLLALSSQNLVDAIENHDKMLKYCKDVLIDIIKKLVSLGILFLK